MTPMPPTKALHHPVAQFSIMGFEISMYAMGQLLPSGASTVPCCWPWLTTNNFFSTE
jgi:hypothetical protein